jgi:hypothetical protein
VRERERQIDDSFISNQNHICLPQCERGKYGERCRWRKEEKERKRDRERERGRERKDELVCDYLREKLDFVKNN